ncbi:MAG: sigma 54-interacting transcriptional regulator [Candidatus Sulfotelmatobacter sp.]
MHPRLFAIAGPLTDSIFPLPMGGATLGREPSNALAVVDPTISQKHFRLRQQDGRFHLLDLESGHATRVNGKAVKEQWLHHGDEIAAGDSVFVFLMEDESDDEPEEETPPPARVEFEEGHPFVETMQFHPRKEVDGLASDWLLSELPETSDVARNLNVLLKISRVVHAVKDLEELQGQLLNLIFEVVPAGRGAILLTDGGEQEFSSLHARTRRPGEPPLVRISRTVARQVMEQGVAILGTDVAGFGSVLKQESLVDAHVCSLLCVPLTVFQKVIGCIYLDSTRSIHRFHEEHLQLMAAIAGICAAALDNARCLQWLEKETQSLTLKTCGEWSLIGEGPRMKEIYQLLTRVAPSDSTVLIEGESGTGKELAARALHRNSARGNQPFVAINCAAIPESLLEDDLFGHERGSFTGAVLQKKGRLEVADGGVVFLDEIGELALSLQVKLLRVLQEREFERVGGTHPIKVDIRLIAATNRDLDEAVRTGTFRRDLYYRLDVVRLRMPSLRERREDIPLLTRHFVQKYSQRCKVKAKPVSREAMARLANHDWPGNVRELENAIERALVLGHTDTLLPEDLPASILEHGPSPAMHMSEARYHSCVKELKKQLILDAVEQTRGNYVEAAGILGVHPNYLHRLIRNLGLKDELKGALRDALRDAARDQSRIGGGLSRVSKGAA